MPTQDSERAVVLSRGERLLGEFVQKAACETSVVASFAKRQHLFELEERLLERMRNAEGYPNTGYNGFAEAIARCLVLYADAPERYARLIRGVCNNELEMFLDSFEGIWRLDLLAAGLADDHDYVFNEQTWTVEIQGPETQHVEGLNPAKFLTLTVAAGK